MTLVLKDLQPYGPLLSLIAVPKDARGPGLLRAGAALLLRGQQELDLNGMSRK